MTPDVNILVAAFRETHPQHAQARRWLTEALEACASGAQLAILPMVAVGFVRVVTNGRVVKLAAPTTQALGFLKSILVTPGAWIPDLGPEWTLFESLCLERDLRGGVISDAWIAAAARAHGLHLVTFDADFRELLRPDQCTVLAPESNLQEPRVKYLAEYWSEQQARAA